MQWGQKNQKQKTPKSHKDKEEIKLTLFAAIFADIEENLKSL